MKRCSAITLGAGIVVMVVLPVTVGLIWAWRTAAEEKRLHTWVVTLTFEDGSTGTVHLDARKPAKNLADTLHQAVLPMFQDTTAPREGYRVLGRIAAKHTYETRSDDNELVAIARAAAKKRHGADVGVTATFTATTSMGAHNVLLTAAGECHLATDEEMKQGPEQHRCRCPDPSIAPRVFAGILAREIRFVHQSQPEWGKTD